MLKLCCNTVWDLSYGKMYSGLEGFRYNPTLHRTSEITTAPSEGDVVMSQIFNINATVFEELNNIFFRFKVASEAKL